MPKEKAAAEKPGDFSDTPGQVPRIEDQLGCGPGQTVSDMETAVILRIQERRALVGAKGLYVNGDLMLAARDAALQLQGGQQFTADPAEFLARFGWRGEDSEVLIIEATSGSPKAPADPSSLITDVAASMPELYAALRNPDRNEIGATVLGSCYRLRAVVILGTRVAAPGPNP